MFRPAKGSYPVYFDTYVNTVTENDLMEALNNQQPVIASFFSALPKDIHEFAYASGKWTLKEVLQHLIDCERIFTYRALCIARKEQQDLISFEENDYAANSMANARNWQELCEEFIAVRQSTLLLFKGFTRQQLESSGTANNKKITVHALGFIIAGHVNHHKKIIEERYLQS